MSKEEVAKRVEQSLDLFEQGQLIDMVAFGEDVRSLITQAAANKAAEEGGLPALPEPVRMSSDQAYLGFSADQMTDYAHQAIAADRASRQVANKAEVAPYGYFRKNGKLFEKLRGRPNEHTLSSGWFPLYATPPATTGASTSSSTDSEKLIELAEAFAFELSCEDHSNSKLEKTKADLVDYVYSVRNFCADKVRNDALEEAASMLLGGSFLHDKAPSKILAEQAAKAIRALKGSVSASTVLTDERIESKLSLNDWVLAGDLYQTTRVYKLEDVRKAIAREVAAQAGQVAVPVARLTITDGLPDRDCMFIDGASLGNGTHELYAAPSPAKESK